MDDLTSCPPPKGRACVAGSTRVSPAFCVDSGDCVTLRVQAKETVSADCTVLSTVYEILNETNAVVGLYSGNLARVKCEAMRVKLVDACVVAQAPAPVAALNIEFSETLLYSESAAIALVRIRRYDEATGAWSLFYENLDGTAFTGTLPTDLTAQTSQVNVVQTATAGCANNATYTKRETAKFDAETGSLKSNTVEYIDASGLVSSATPVGFALGACFDPQTTTIASNTAATNTALTSLQTATVAGDAAVVTAVNTNTSSTFNILNSSFTTLQDAVNNGFASLRGLPDAEYTHTDGCRNGVSTPRRELLLVTTFSLNPTPVSSRVEYYNAQSGWTVGPEVLPDWTPGPCPGPANPNADIVAAINAASANEISNATTLNGGLIATLAATSGNEIAAINVASSQATTIATGASVANVTAINAASTNEIAALGGVVTQISSLQTAVQSLVDIEYVQTPGCLNGVYTPRQDVYSRNTTTGAATVLAEQYLVAGLWVTGGAGAWTPGPCPVVIVDKPVCSFAAQRASGVYNAVYAIPAFSNSWTAQGVVGLQSVTIAPIKGAGVPAGQNYTEVRFGPALSPTIIRLTEEYPAFTWSVAQDAGNTAETLDNLITATAVGNSAFIATWTAACVANPPNPSVARIGWATSLELPTTYSAAAAGTEGMTPYVSGFRDLILRFSLLGASPALNLAVTPGTDTIGGVVGYDPATGLGFYRMNFSRQFYTPGTARIELTDNGALLGALLVVYVNNTPATSYGDAQWVAYSAV